MVVIVIFLFYIFPDSTSVKESAGQCRRCKRCEFDPWVWKDLLGQNMATHSSILGAWKIPRTEEPGEPQAMGCKRITYH